MFVYLFVLCTGIIKNHWPKEKNKRNIEIIFPELLKQKEEKKKKIEEEEKKA